MPKLAFVQHCDLLKFASSASDGGNLAINNIHQTSFTYCLSLMLEKGHLKQTKFILRDWNECWYEMMHIMRKDCLSFTNNDGAFI